MDPEEILAQLPKPDMSLRELAKTQSVSMLKTTKPKFP